MTGLTKAPITRIYTTKGDNCYDWNGIKCDKAVGVVINDKIHWIDESFGTQDELERILGRFGIALHGKKGNWAPWVDNEADFRDGNKVTKISKHHDDVFNGKSIYCTRAKRKDNGKLWWKISDIQALYN